MGDLKLKRIQVQLIKWYKRKWSTEEKTYPWRDSNRSPYEILIAEILLQHTTAKAIVDNNIYALFLKNFPSIKVIITSNRESIEKILRPIGLYVQKSYRIKKMAKQIKNFYDGKIPQAKEDLLSLSGIGDYISNAMITFAFNGNEVPLDGNLIRISQNLWEIKEKKDQLEVLKALSELNPKLIYWSLFDLGRFHCRRPKPSCDLCPIRIYCSYYLKKSKNRSPKFQPKLH
jgi:A/G-specific adenine glycosylase